MLPTENTHADRHADHRLHLHLVHEREDRRNCGSPSRAPLLSAGEGSCVLLAGADRQCRSALRQELGRTLSEGTVFIEADEAWEVLQQAPASRIVILTGDLREVSADTITRLLGRHYPTLPVLSLDDGPALVARDAEPLAAIDSARDAI
jgi:hypothetical protein